jgi:hypothetical protein
LGQKSHLVASSALQLGANLGANFLTPPLYQPNSILGDFHASLLKCCQQGGFAPGALYIVTLSVSYSVQHDGCATL